MKKQGGYTLIELLLVIVITSLFTTLIIFFTFNYWPYSYLLQNDLYTFVTRLNAGDLLRENIGSSSGFISQNSIADSHTLNPETTGGSYWIKKHAIPGNIPIGTTGTTTPILYFRRFSVNSSRAYIMNGTQPYEDEYVLYLNGTTKELLLRSIANPNASGNRLLTSCPKAIATTTCPADSVIASDIGSIDLRFFSRSGNIVDWTSVYDSINSRYAGPDYAAVEVLELTLNITKKAVFQKSNTTQSNTIIRIALRNT